MDSSRGITAGNGADNMFAVIVSVIMGAAAWQHPAGLITHQTLDEVRGKLETQAWARPVWDARKAGVSLWMTPSPEDLRRVFPTRRGNVYHNFSCPECRVRLKFDPFHPGPFECPSCGKTYAPDTDAGIYPKGDIYNGAMYDGWICLFYLQAAEAAADMAVIGRLESDEAYFARSRALLGLFADTIRNCPTDHAGDGDSVSDSYLQARRGQQGSVGSCGGVRTVPRWHGGRGAVPNRDGCAETHAR